MLRLHILWVLSLAGCQDTPFQNQLNSESSTVDSIEETGSAEPVSVGGGFLTCERLLPTTDANAKDQAYCRLQIGEKKMEIDANAKASFQVRLVSGGHHEEIDHENLAISEEWHWLVSITKGKIFTAIVLDLGGELESDGDLYVFATGHWFSGEEGGVSNNNDLTHSLTLAKNSQLFIVGDSNRDWNRDCERPIRDEIASQAATIESTKNFFIEVPEGGALLNIEIPAICGIARDSIPPLVKLSYPDLDREPEGYMIPQLSKMFVLEKMFVDSGRLTITIESLPERKNRNYETFAFGNPVLLSDKEIKEISNSP